MLLPFHLAGILNFNFNMSSVPNLATSLPIVGRGRGRGAPTLADVPLRRPGHEITETVSSLSLGPTSSKKNYIEELSKTLSTVKTSDELKKLVTSLVDEALDSQQLCQKLLVEVKKVVNVTVEDKKFRNVFLSQIQAVFQERESTLRISQDRYANLLYLLHDSAKALRLPNGDPIIPLVSAVSKCLSPALRGSITHGLSVCVRKTVFSLLDDLWKHSPEESEEFFEKVRELVILNSLDMNIGNELLFLVELEHYRKVCDVPAAMFAYYRAKGLTFA